jgi:hypothetical protein
MAPVLLERYRKTGKRIDAATDRGEKVDHLRSMRSFDCYDHSALLAGHWFGCGFFQVPRASASDFFEVGRQSFHFASW